MYLLKLNICIFNKIKLFHIKMFKMFKLIKHFVNVNYLFKLLIPRKQVFLTLKEKNKVKKNEYKFMLNT